jgi:signal transduction histidine kinase
VNREGEGPAADVLLALNRASTTARLMAGTIHDVNNALQVISGSVELLEQQQGLPLTVGKSLDRIRRQCERAAELLADVQRFTKAPLEGRERFNLRELVERSIALRRFAATRAGLTVDLQTSDAAGAVAVGNVGLVQQALLNVLVNAEQAMAGAPGVIVVGLRAEGSYSGVEVSDTGGGLDAALLARISEPFASTKSATEGAGLGLWASKTIAEASGGRLDIRSAPTGTTCVLWLPTELR